VLPAGTLAIRLGVPDGGAGSPRRILRYAVLGDGNDPGLGLAPSGSGRADPCVPRFLRELFSTMGQTTGIVTSVTNGMIEILGGATGVVLASAFFAAWRVARFKLAVCNVAERAAGRWRRR
jgi:hypothetical protein